MRNVFSSSSAIASAMHRWSIAFDLFQEMQWYRVVGNELTYSALISACEKGREWKLAGTLMPLSSQKDTITISALLSAFQKADRWEGAFHQLNLMPLRRVLPNAFSINSVIGSGCDGCWAQPLFMLRAPKLTAVIDEISYNSVMMSICEEVQQWRVALELLSSMGQHRVQPDEARRTMMAMMATFWYQLLRTVKQDPSPITPAKSLIVLSRLHHTCRGPQNVKSSPFLRA